MGKWLSLYPNLLTISVAGGFSLMSSIRSSRPAPKFKASLRKAAARTVTTLIEAVVDVPKTFTVRMRNYLRHCGYLQKI